MLYEVLDYAVAYSRMLTNMLHRGRRSRPPMQALVSADSLEVNYDARSDTGLFCLSFSTTLSLPSGGPPVVDEGSELTTELTPPSGGPF